MLTFLFQNLSQISSVASLKSPFASTPFSSDSSLHLLLIGLILSEPQICHQNPSFASDLDLVVLSIRPPGSRTDSSMVVETQSALGAAANGHIAKTCKLQIRCYCCGAFGHKRQNCVSVEKKKPYSMEEERVSVCSSEWFSTQHLEAEKWGDCMLLDSDVTACMQAVPAPLILSTYEGNKQIIEELSDPLIAAREDPVGGCTSSSLHAEDFSSFSLGSRSTKGDGLRPWSRSESGELVYIQDSNSPGLLIEDVYTSPVTYNNSGSGIQLDLSPDPFDSFADFFIIDEFEDYYTDEDAIIPEIFSHQPAQIMGQDLVEDSPVRGLEIWTHMDRPSLLFYCCFQAADGFARLDRAIESKSTYKIWARGSNVLSPFKPESKRKPVLLPVKCKSEISPVNYKQASSKKASKTNNRGPIMLCAVRRSPRSVSKKISRSSKLESPASV